MLGVVSEDVSSVVSLFGVVNEDVSSVVSLLGVVFQKMKSNEPGRQK